MTAAACMLKGPKDKVVMVLTSGLGWFPAESYQKSQEGPPDGPLVTKKSTVVVVGCGSFSEGSGPFSFTGIQQRI